MQKETDPASSVPTLLCRGCVPVSLNDSSDLEWPEPLMDEFATLMELLLGPRALGGLGQCEPGFLELVACLLPS